MHSMHSYATLIMGIAAICTPLAAAPPRVVTPGYALELVAREPAIVTPVALALTRDGSLLVVESHTHQRPDGYAGAESDRIRRYSDTDGDGNFDTWSTYAEGFRHAMNVAVRDDGSVIVVTRSDVTLLKDTNNDGAADERSILVRLESDVEYPHNALSGYVSDGKGGFYLGLGENFGGAYRLVGSDGSEFADSGGTGMVFRFNNDGSNLKRFAQGFWNPFGLAIAGSHTLFAVDNDPDASPPCRLIHVVETGDYGHRFEYGRAGVHPLQAWDGELPGTLPMVCGTGEAPCAVVPHENHLWVTSWGDHRLERYELTANGMSFTAKREVVVQGDADFRPTGCAVAPDGSIYFADWVSRSYPVHGAGRIWRLTSRVPVERHEWQAIATVESAAGRQSLATQAASSDPFQRQSAVAASSKAEAVEFTSRGETRLAGLQWHRWNNVDNRDELLMPALSDTDPSVQLYAVRWIADHHLTTYRDQVAALLDGQIPDQRYYLALLAAIHWLDGDRNPPPQDVTDSLLARELRNTRRSDELKSLALRLISPDHKQLTIEVLWAYIQGDHEPLRTEAVRTLALSLHEDRFTWLAKLAGDETLGEATRADAVVGLAAQAEQFRPLLERLATSGVPTVADEAARTLRLANHTASPPQFLPEATDIDAWLALTDGIGDAEAGRRLFYNALGPRCGTCHSVDGHGGKYGPDLTRYGATHDRRQTLTAVLQPSRDIAPRYVPWVLETLDGKTHVGLRLPLGGDGGVEPYIDSAGNRFDLESENVEYREPSKNSIMPEGIEKTLTIDELADVVAFLLHQTRE